MGDFLQEQVTVFEEKIGYCFQDKKLIRQALTHSSYANEQKINNMGDYERIEFLGDAVLELISSEFLFRENPQMLEGEMTKLRSSLVCEQALAYCAREMGLGTFILLGKGEEASGGRDRDSIISDVMEAVIGAIYLDGGFASAKEQVDRWILSDLENKKLFYDSKTILQELVQSQEGGHLTYALLEERGPDHAKEFLVEVRINDRKIAEGVGKTKKRAEQKAAYQALLQYKNK